MILRKNFYTQKILYQKPIIGKIEIFKSNWYIGKYWGNMKEFREKSCVCGHRLFSTQCQKLKLNCPLHK